MREKYDDALDTYYKVQKAESWFMLACYTFLSDISLFVHSALNQYEINIKSMLV